MKKIMGLAVALLVLSAGRPMAADLDEQALGAAVAELESFYPKVEGYVVSVTGGLVYTDIPGVAGLRPGSELGTYREGAEIVHPLTRQVLGRYETMLGVLRLSQVRADYSAGEAVWLKPGEEIRPGDRVRITSSRLRVALAVPEGDPGEGDWSRWQNEAYFALEKSARFYPVEGGQAPAAEAFSRPEKLREEAAARSLDAFLRLDAVGPEEERYLSLKLFSGASGAMVASSRAPFRRAQAARPQAAAGTAPVRAPEGARGKGPGWDVQEADFALVGLCAGRLTGAGGDEIALTDGRRLAVKARREGTWETVWEDKGKANWRILALDCGDLDGNGVEEIFVTRIGTGILDSQVLEYRAGAFVPKVEAKKLFFRVIERGGRASLWGQELSAGRPLEGAVRELIWTGGDYSPKPGPPLGIPFVYGFTLTDVDGDSQDEVAWLNDGDRLELYELGGKRLWASDRSFGGSANFVDAQTLGQELGREGEVGGLVIRGRMIAARLEGDDRDSLLLYRNVPKLGSVLAGVRIFDRAEMGAWRWDGLKLAPAAPPEELQGYVADYALAASADGAAEVVAGLNGSPGFFKSGGGKIIARPVGLFFAEP